MSAEFVISVDPTRNLLRITLGGFFERDEFVRFKAALLDAHRQLPCRANTHRALTDIRDMKIQSQEMVQAFQQLLAAPEHQAARTGFIVASSLARTQLVRAVDKREVRYFQNADEAEAWILAEEIDTRAA